MTCPSCGAARSYVGVSSPARRLCACEKGHACAECGKPAVIVEFQDRIKDREPSLPKKSSADVVFLCEEDRPSGFPDAKKAPVAVEPEEPPPAPRFTSQSTARVVCWSCKHVHMVKQRKNHNGSYSDCPRCGDDMYTLCMDDDDAAVA